MKDDGRGDVKGRAAWFGARLTTKSSSSWVSLELSNLNCEEGNQKGEVRNGGQLTKLRGFAQLNLIGTETPEMGYFVDGVP